MAFDETFLRGRLKRDFGLDLPIGSGSGTSRDDPIVILTSDPRVAALTQMLVLRCIGTALERLWRVKAKTLLEGEWGNIEQIKIETKELTATEIITQRINHYFDVSASVAGRVSAASGRPQDLEVAGYSDPVSGIAFPYEIGWMHFDNTIVNEEANPGLGQTILYTALNSKASVYVYDRGGRAPARFEPDFLTPEFSVAASDVLKFTSNARSAGDGKLTASGSGISYLRQDFRMDADHSVLALTVARGRFVKVRATWLAEPLFDDIGNEFIEQVFDLASLHQLH